MGISDDEIDELAGGDSPDQPDDALDPDTGVDDSGGDDSPDDAGGDVSGDADGGGDPKPDEPKEDKQSGQTVPLAVLLDERKTFQERLEAQDRKLERFARLDEKLTQALEKKKEPEPDPDYLDDPKGYIDHKLQKATQAVSETSQNVTEIRQQQEHAAQIQQLNTRLSTYDQEFVQSGHEDYYDALSHIRDINVQNGLDMGMNEQDAKIQAAQAMFAIQAQVMHNGKNPAEFMYNMANRWGYKKAEAEPEGKKDEIDDEAMDAAAKGADAQSMGGGAAPDLDELVDMEDDEFTEAMTELFGEEFVK